MSGLLTLPPEVLEHCLLPFLGWNDLLRLRRVSTAAKALVHGYVKVNPKLAPEIKIGDKEPERNVKAFLDLDLPSAKIYLRNDYGGSGFYQENSEELSEFLEVYGSVVTHLRVDHFSVYCSGMERTFLEGLANLQSFEAEWFDTVNVDMMSPVPRVFGNVTVLKLQRHGDGISFNRSVNDGVNGLIKLLTACRSLEHFRPLRFFEITRESSTKLVQFLDAAIQQRKDNPETLSKLKVIDFDFGSLGLEWFDNIREEEMNRAENPYVQFLRTCAVHGILLQRVSSGKCLENFARNRGNLFIPIQSLFLTSDEPYSWTWMMETEMPILEKVSLGTLTRSREAEDIQHDRIITRSANWPMLKSLNINLGWSTTGTNETYLREIRDLFRMLFEGISRTALTELKLWFWGKVGNGNDLLKVECLTTCCPNLKKLELVNWGGNNEQFVKLWQGLTNLEEIILRRCFGLGIQGFMGTDAQNPAFLKLKKLKKLVLQELSEMPGIAENLFLSVIRHLSLTHFAVTAEDPLEEKCLKLLLGGPFEKSIQKFSFELHGWYDFGALQRENMKLQKFFGLSNTL